MNTILLVVQVCLSIGIVTLVLLQQGKGANEGATFGGGATSVFGAQGSSNFLSKTTAVLATLFFINCLTLAYLAAHRNAPLSVGQQIQQQTHQKKSSEPEKPLFSGSNEKAPKSLKAPAEQKSANTTKPPASKK